MTIIAYLAELDSRSEWIGDRVAVDLNPQFTVDGALKLYEVLLLVQLKTGTYQSVKQPFYVLDEGGAGETIYPVNQERKSEAPNPFRDQVRAFADGQITADRPKITVDSVDEANEFALVTAYESEAGGPISVKRYFVARDDQGAPYIREYLG